jgi:lysophospholipase L1-like esterase
LFYKSNPTLQDGDYIILVLFSDASGTWMKTLNYDNSFIKQKQLPYEKVINRLTIIGDSLTAVGKWYEVIDDYGSKLKVLKRNVQAVSGATLYEHGYGYAGSVQVGDVVILFMGTNDCLKEIPLGDPSTDNTSSTTFCGMFKKIIESMYDKDKSITILVVGGSPLNGYRYNESKPQKYYDDVKPFSEAIKTMCSQYAIPYLNLLENIGINSYNASETQIDGCHYSQAMYKRLGNMIYEKLYSIL